MNTASQDRQKKTYTVTIVGSIGNAILLAFKFIAGFVGHSAAMIADAVHSLSDFITDVVVFVFVKISAKPSDDSHDYGHGKFETLATTIISLMLFFVGLGILYSAILKIIAFCRGQELPAPGMIAFIAAIVSIVVKEGLYQYTIRTARSIDSKVLEANAWHHRSDAFSSIGTAIGIACAIFLGVKGRVCDPIAAVIVSFFIVRVAWQLMKGSLEELLERSLPKNVEDSILSSVSQCPEVSSPHNLRTRRIGNYSAVELHVRMDPDMTVGRSHEITRQLEQRIKDLLGPATIVTIHVEPKKQ